MRPKIGLVLEGGSALGLAHIGVLRWLEEHHVPISYVAGTSMGGLVGGMYATGLSADELQGLIETIDWDELLQGQTPYQELSFRRKEDAFEYPNRLEFGLKKGLRFPEGFNAGQQVISILDRVALPYSNLRDFNELPTPICLCCHRPCELAKNCFPERLPIHCSALHHVVARTFYSCPLGRVHPG